MEMDTPRNLVCSRNLAETREPKSNTLHIFAIYSLRLRQIALKPRSLLKTWFGRSGKGFIVHGTKTKTLVNKPKVRVTPSGNFYIGCTVVVMVLISTGAVIWKDFKFSTTQDYLMFFLGLASCLI